MKFQRYLHNHEASLEDVNCEPVPFCDRRERNGGWENIGWRTREEERSSSCAMRDAMMDWCQPKAGRKDWANECGGGSSWLGAGLCAPGHCHRPSRVLLEDGTTRSRTPMLTVIDILSQCFSSHSAVNRPQAIYRLRAAGDSRPEHMTEPQQSGALQMTPVFMSEREIGKCFVSLVRTVWIEFSLNCRWTTRHRRGLLCQAKSSPRIKARWATQAPCLHDWQLHNCSCAFVRKIANTTETRSFLSVLTKGGALLSPQVTIPRWPSDRVNWKC